MKKALLIWIAVCLAVVLLPKAIDRFTPKVIVKEVPVIKEVIKEIIKEVPIYKGERIIEKEKIVYQPLQDNIFLINKISDTEYSVGINDQLWTGNVVIEVKANAIHFHKLNSRPSVMYGMTHPEAYPR